MGARREYPQFAGLTMDDWTELLRIAKLSPQQKEVATQCVIWRKMTLVEIGEIHGVDRRTITNWMNDDIIPELVCMLPYLRRKVV
jgi:hypothetical protein